MTDQLPHNWTTKKIGEIFEFKYGKGLPQEKRASVGSVSVYGSNGVVGTHSSAITRGPTIVVGRKGSVGETHLSSMPCWPIDTTYFIDEFPSKFPPRYWALYLQSLRLGQQDKSSAIPGISRDDIYKLEVAVPPLDEQSRILAKLEIVLGKFDACNTRLARIPTILKRFRQSVLAAACSGRLTADWRESASKEQLKLGEIANPKRAVPVDTLFDVPDYWSWLPLEALCNPKRSICYGVIKLGPVVENGVHCLRTSDVKPLRIDTDNVKTIDPVISDAYRRTVLQGDEILVNVRGTLGGVAVVPNELRGWNISREVAVAPVAGIINQFAAFWIASMPCQNWLTGVAKGVAYTGINIEDLRLLPIALPSIEEQKEIVRRVESLFTLADQLEARYKKGKAYVDKLTQSILAKAFRGELVPQDPNDEPAEKLLEQLNAARLNT